MTEQEWLACEDPLDMLREPPASQATERKLRLFACACCRRVWDHFSPTNRENVELAERYADGCASASELEDREVSPRLCRDVDDPEPEPDFADRGIPFWCDYAAWKVTEALGTCWVDDVCDTTRRIAGRRSGVWEEITQATLLRDVLGNPFRSVALDSAWLTTTVTALAQAIYDDRDFDRMPILADALEDAGCTSQAILAHCRGPGLHVRGCWVVDLLLGKE